MMIDIVACTPGDLVELTELARRTFVEAFAHQNTAEDMRDYIEKAFSPEQMKKELSQPESLFYFAKSKEKTIGYLKLNFGAAQTDIKEKEGMEIERIYVKKEYQSAGIGAQLFDYALDIARTKKLAYLWLGVWEKNQRAIRFYKRQGLVPFNKHVFYLGKDKQMDILMKIELI